MKKPEEIKKGLEYLQITDVSEKIKAAKRCLNYSYVEDVARDALALIQQLEKKALDLGEYMELSDFLGDRVKELEAQVPRWISVEEKLPEGEDPVLILVKETEHYGLHKEKSKVYYCQYLAYWDDEEWYTTWCNGCRKITDTANEPNADDYEVTHWMPLPEAPKEDAQ